MWEEQGCSGVCPALGQAMAPAWALVCVWGCSSAQGPGLGCLRKMGSSQCSQTLVTHNRARGRLHCLLFMEGNCVFSEGDGGSRGAEQQRHPAQALDGSLGSPFRSTGAAHSAHGLAGARSWERGQAGHGCLGWHSCPVGTLLSPGESVRHLSPRCAGMMRYLSSQVSVAWEQVNRNGKLFILKCCRHWNEALVRGNWKMCPLLFNFLISLLHLTEYKEGNF